MLFAATAANALAQGFPDARGRDEGRGDGGGNSQVQEPESQRGYDEPIDSIDQPFLSINAINGSVIDPVRGY